MKTKWEEETCSSLPEQFEQLNTDTWIQRKDIHKEGQDGYKCQVRYISSDVYEKILDSYDSPAYQATVDQADANDAANAEMLLEQLQIAEAQAQQDEVLAEILLNTMSTEVN